MRTSATHMLLSHLRLSKVLSGISNYEYCRCLPRALVFPPGRAWCGHRCSPILYEVVQFAFDTIDFSNICKPLLDVFFFLARFLGVRDAQTQPAEFHLAQMNTGPEAFFFC